MTRKRTIGGWHEDEAAAAFEDAGVASVWVADALLRASGGEEEEEEVEARVKCRVDGTGHVKSVAIPARALTWQPFLLISTIT